MKDSNQKPSNDRIHFQSKKYKRKVSLCREFIEHNLGVKLEEFIREANWAENAELCIHILNDCPTVDEENYVNTKLGSLSHLRDKRSPLEYACDLIVGWTIEDGFIKLLETEAGLKCSLVSADKRREFLRRPKASADISVETADGEGFRFELVKDFTGHWQKKKKIDLRDRKYLNLKEENGILVGIDFKYGKFFVLNVNEAEAEYITSHYPYGGKPAYSISLRDVKFYDLHSMKEVIGRILHRLGANKAKF